MDKQLNSAHVVEQAIRIAGKEGYSGAYKALGGGEGNDTFAIECDGRGKLVLRVARYENQTSLENEALALGLLNLDQVPELIFFDKDSRIDGKMWILESYISGSIVTRPDLSQFASLGKLLAQIHQVQGEIRGIDAWQHFLESCHKFGDEKHLMLHPDSSLRELIVAGRTYIQKHQLMLTDVLPSLTQGDATPSNILVSDGKAALIDWEFSTFNDPMAEFSTLYYEDMEYNRGKWRLHITPDERNVLFRSYEESGGKIDPDRVKLWMNIDKLGAAIFLYWRIHHSDREANAEQMSQYQLDLQNLISSLEHNLY